MRKKTIRLNGLKIGMVGLGLMSIVGVVAAYKSGWTGELRSKAAADNFTIDFGRVETVYDYSSQHCANEPDDFPDMPARMFIGMDGKVQMVAGNSVPNRRSIGNNLSEMTHDCSGQPLMRSEHNLDPANSRDYSWLISPYVVEVAPGLPIISLVHNEYHAHEDPRHGGFKNCNIVDESRFLKCWWGSVNWAVSHDNGKSYVQPQSPQHVVSSIGFGYSPDNKQHYGAMEPSNILFRQGYYYSLVTVQIPTEKEPYVQGKTCVMRTNNLLDPKSWRYWDGKDFLIEATDASACTKVMNSGWSLAVTMNNYLGKYISLGCHWQDKACMKLSSNLLAWEKGQIDMMAPGYYAYGSIIQPGDPTRNFEVSDRSPWLYYVACGDGSNTNFCNGPDRDVKRVRIRFNKKQDIGKYDLIDLRFNEMTGMKALDSSFYVNDGTVIGESGFTIGDNRRYFHFGGANYISVANSDSMSVGSTFSIYLKLKTNMVPTSGQYPVLINKADNTKRNYGLFMTPAGKLHFSLMNGASFSGSVGNKAINDGLWHTVIVVYDNNLKTTKYYIDNVLDASVTQLGALTDGMNSGSTLIGAGGFVGDIDEIALYNFAIK